MSGQVSQDVRDSSDTYAFTINDNGRNTSASDNGSTVGSYLYNGFEQRVQKMAGGTTTDLIYDRLGHLLEEVNGSTGGAIREYLWMDDMPVAMVDDTGASPVLYYIHTDQLGSPQKITDASLNIDWDGAFDPFGNVASLTGSLTNNLRFPGQYADAETALNQNWFRDYDPTIGRYIQSDPIGLAMSVNNYGYTSNNPVSNLDSAGLFCTSASGFVFCSYPGGPSFVLPAPPGFPAYLGPDDWLYHNYDVREDIGCVDPSDVMQAIVNTPTPGSPNPASLQGTNNNAQVLGIDNPVTSYLTTDDASSLGSGLTTFCTFARVFEAFPA